MPKPVKKRPQKPKRPSSDPNLRARQMMAEHMAKAGEQTGTLPAAPSFQEQLSAHMAKLGAKGGKVSGAKRMEMPEKTRKEIARKAAAARWNRKAFLDRRRLTKSASVLAIPQNPCGCARQVGCRDVSRMLLSIGHCQQPCGKDPSGFLAAHSFDRHTAGDLHVVRNNR